MDGKYTSSFGCMGLLDPLCPMQWIHAAAEDLSRSKLKCSVSAEYIYFEDLMWGKKRDVKYLVNCCMDCLLK